MKNTPKIDWKKVIDEYDNETYEGYVNGSKLFVIHPDCSEAELCVYPYVDVWGIAICYTSVKRAKEGAKRCLKKWHAVFQ